MRQPFDDKEPGGSSDALTSHFYRLNRVIPDDQEVIKIDPNVRASDAIRLMQLRRVSQVPVVEGTEVLGVFSFRSFSIGAMQLQDDKTSPGSLPVTEFIEDFHFARVTDEFDELIQMLDQDDAVLVGEPARLQAIISSIDVLRYLYGVASPYFLMEEVELAIRGLIRVSVADPDSFLNCVAKALSSKYPQERLPPILEDMTFNDYAQLIGNNDNWPRFELAFGGTRNRTRAKLESLAGLRNNLFHFKRHITVEEYQELSERRQWLLMRSRLAQARRTGLGN